MVYVALVFVDWICKQVFSVIPLISTVWYVFPFQPVPLLKIMLNSVLSVCVYTYQSPSLVVGYSVPAPLVHTHTIISSFSHAAGTLAFTTIGIGHSSRNSLTYCAQSDASYAASVPQGITQTGEGVFINTVLSSNAGGVVAST